MIDGKARPGIGSPQLAIGHGKWLKIIPIFWEHFQLLISFWILYPSFFSFFPFMLFLFLSTFLSSQVYDVTSFLSLHPGGGQLVVDAAAQDGGICIKSWVNSKACPFFVFFSSMLAKGNELLNVK